VSSYTRYHIPNESAPNIAPHPNRFRVKVDRLLLARLIVTELIRQRANWPVVSSRPCIYGVLSSPIGGFAPRPQHCVGCLRCTMEYPDIIRICPNPARRTLGDSYFTPDTVDTVLYEATTGRVPVKGAGFRGRFGGPGWDGMWTDMSEIVRPTRDGIHGREFISTSVDLGYKPAHLTFGPNGNVSGDLPRTTSIELPIIFDALPVSVESPSLYRAVASAAEKTKTLAVVPLARVLEYHLGSPAVVPLVPPDKIDSLARVSPRPRMVELDGWAESPYRELCRGFPEIIVCVRLPFTFDVLRLVQEGVQVIHLVADYHGNAGNTFVLDAIRRVHEQLVAEGIREQCTLIGSGGIIAAEHVAKAIICGVDAVAVDTAPVIAIQGRFAGECLDRLTAVITLRRLDPGWAVQRLVNLAGSWHDQLLEVLGAMGLREVRRLRGEVGRAMFHADLEREAFGGIEGFEPAEGPAAT
jgi:hypothetical protein